MPSGDMDYDDDNDDRRDHASATFSKTDWSSTTPDEMKLSEVKLDDSRASTETFLVFGGNSAGCPAGNAQKAVCEAFPCQFHEIEERIRAGLGDEWDDDCWPLDPEPTVYLSTRGDGPRLVSCTVFPRDARHEYETARRVFREALWVAVSAGTKKLRSVPTRSDSPPTTIRVVTHGLGVFTGHQAPWRFASSVAMGLGDYLEQQQDDMELHGAKHLEGDPR